MAKCDELAGDRTLLAETAALHRTRSLPLKARQQFGALNKALRDKIRSTLPALKQASDSLENADCLYHTAKLLVLDLERAELIGAAEELGGVFNMQYAPVQTQPPIVGPAAIALHFLTEYLARRPVGSRATEAALITRGVPFSDKLQDRGPFPGQLALETKPIVIAYCAHSSGLDFAEIEPFLAEHVEKAAREVRACLFLKEFGGFLTNQTARMDYQSFRNEKTLRSRNLEQVRFGISPFALERESDFTQQLLRFLIGWHIPVVSEDLSFESWCLHEQADALEKAVQQSVTNGRRAQIVQAFTDAKVAQVAALRARDVELAKQIRSELHAKPDTLLLTARGAHHQFTLSRELHLLQIQCQQFNAYQGWTTQEDRFTEVVRIQEGTEDFRPTAAQELLILRAVLANILRNVMETFQATPLYRGPRVSSSYKSRMASQIADRWDEPAVERYFAVPVAHRGMFVRNWLMENATAEERPMFNWCS